MTGNKGVLTRRYEALLAEYPGEERFFENNMSDLFFAMEDIRTDSELSDIRRLYETFNLSTEHPFQYASSSCYAAEDAMIELLDFKRSLVNRVLH